MKPLLAHVYEPHRVTYPCYVQPKLNGIRALYQHGRFQSRDQLPFPQGLLDHLARPLLATFDPSVILDGELYVHGWPLQRINAAVTPVRQQPTEDTLQVEYHVFDRLDLTLPFWERHNYLNRTGLRNYHKGEGDPTKECLFKSNKIEQVHFVEAHPAMTEEDANIHYAYFVGAGYEGLMYRLGHCPYTTPKQPGLGSGRTKFLSDKDNRCWHLLKRKDWQDAEFRCVGVVEGEGKLKGMLGALVCVIDEEARAFLFGESITGRRFNVGSGLTDAERIHYWSNPPIGRDVKVKYLCLSSDGIPLNPTILAIL